MFLSQFQPTTAPSRKTNLSDNHRAVWRLFHFDPKAKRSFLFRPDPQRLLVLSQLPPLPQIEGWSSIVARFDPQPALGDHFLFRVRVNPTVTRLGCRRDPIQHRKVTQPDWAEHFTLSELVQQEGTAWLRAREAGFGFQTVGAGPLASDYRSHRFQKWREGQSSGRTVTLATLELSGEAVVTDPALFRQALTQGIGRAKGYGCGLLLIQKLIKECP